MVNQTRFRLVVAGALLCNVIAVMLIWEQPDCAASESCRTTITIAEALTQLV